MADAQSIADALRKAITIDHLEIQDESSGCGQNFSVLIVSDAFEGKGTLARHRIVNDALKEQIGLMHAFSQKTLTPAQYELQVGKKIRQASVEGEDVLESGVKESRVPASGIDHGTKRRRKMPPFAPLYPPYDPTDKTSFAYETVVRRWPVIITAIIDRVHNVCHHLSLVKPLEMDVGVEDKIKEGTNIIERISALKYRMGRDQALELIEDDGEFLVDVYNQGLSKLEAQRKNTWFTAPWLFTECYLYRLLRSYFRQTENWQDYDPFADQKLDMFRKSGAAVYQIATTMHALGEESETIRQSPEKMKILFHEMLQMCLWGNATDLSLLTHLSQEDITRLQTASRDAQDAREKFILRDDHEVVWQHVQSLKNDRIDFVLDNSGFELFTDLVFADFLVTHTPYVAKVVFHPKQIPWFVSDVTPLDFQEIFAFLGAPNFTVNSKAETQGHLSEMVQRWNDYISRGVFALSVPSGARLGAKEDTQNAEFWIRPEPYWELPEKAQELARALEDSGLVIFKGDLNFRKLTGDIRWPAWTPFAEAIGPLAGAFPLLSLRTNKADVVVGVKRDVAEYLDAKEAGWRVDGRYALISFAGKAKEG